MPASKPGLVAGTHDLASPTVAARITPAKPSEASLPARCQAFPGPPVLDLGRPEVGIGARRRRSAPPRLRAVLSTANPLHRVLGSRSGAHWRKMRAVKRGSGGTTWPNDRAAGGNGGCTLAAASHPGSFSRFGQGGPVSYAFSAPNGCRWTGQKLQPPSSSGLGRRPFTAVARVRIPLGVRSGPPEGGQDQPQGPVAQLVSAPPCHGGGRGFKSRRGREY